MDGILKLNSLQKRNYIRSRKILDSAKGEQCTIQSPICNYNPETIVCCHSNESDDGKGGRIKAEDIYIAYGCAACHDFVDGRIQRSLWAEVTRKEYLDRGIKRTWKRLIEKGIIKIT
jgi:hypothetical protein